MMIEENMMMAMDDNTHRKSNRGSTKDKNIPKEVLGFQFDDSVTKAAIFYFSRLPTIEKKTKFNKACARFYGLTLILFSIGIVMI